MHISLNEGKYVDADDISIVVSVDTLATQSTYLNKLQEEGKVIDVSLEKKDGKKVSRIRTLVFTKQGYAIATNVKVETIMKRIANVAGAVPLTGNQK